MRGSKFRTTITGDGDANQRTPSLMVIPWISSSVGRIEGNPGGYDSVTTTAVTS